MSYTVWIAVENDDTGGKAWWSVDHHDNKEEAEQQAADLATLMYEHEGIDPVRIEDDRDYDVG